MEQMEIKRILAENPELMQLLAIIDGLGLKDCWLAAGTIRNFIWNYLRGKGQLDRLTDIDVVFFDPLISYQTTLTIQQHLQAAHPHYDWEVKNQVWMHQHSPNTPPYQSARDAIAKFPECCTAIGARLEQDRLELFCPYGVDDLVNFIVRPTPHFLADPQRRVVYQARVNQKDWSKKWPQLKIYLIE